MIAQVAARGKPAKSPHCHRPGHRNDSRNGPYPQRIMVRHEVINDTVGGLPVAITYCPLVGDILAIERGDTTFGVSGRIVNSNLTLFNRKNGAHVPQMLSIWIDGPMAGRALVEHPVAWTTWDRWRALHPDTAVMCPPPGGAFANYTDPYGGYNPLHGYYLPDRPPMFPPLHVDERFPPKRIFIGARTPDRAVAFDLAGNTRPSRRPTPAIPNRASAPASARRSASILQNNLHRARCLWPDRELQPDAL
jgi:hypothetical protein